MSLSYYYRKGEEGNSEFGNFVITLICVQQILFPPFRYSGPVDSWCSLVLDQCTFGKKFNPCMTYNSNDFFLELNHLYIFYLDMNHFFKKKMTWQTKYLFSISRTDLILKFVFCFFFTDLEKLWRILLHKFTSTQWLIEPKWIARYVEYKI